MSRRSSKGNDKVRLVEAAAMARRSYNQMLRLVLRGDIAGERDAGGRWWVSLSSLNALLSDEQANVV
jgi:hypothetical protein